MYRIGKANGRGKCKRCHEKIPRDSIQLIYVTGEYHAYSYRYCKKCSEIILKDEIEHLHSLLGKLSPDNLCLINFAGADIRQSLEKKGIKLSKEEFTDLLYKIGHDLEHYECWACIESALESEIKAYLGKK